MTVYFYIYEHIKMKYIRGLWTLLYKHCTFQTNNNVRFKSVYVRCRVKKQSEKSCGFGFCSLSSYIRPEFKIQLFLNKSSPRNFTF